MPQVDSDQRHVPIPLFIGQHEMRPIAVIERQKVQMRRQPYIHSEWEVELFICLRVVDRKIRRAPKRPNSFGESEIVRLLSLRGADTIAGSPKCDQWRSVGLRRQNPVCSRNDFRDCEIKL